MMKERADSSKHTFAHTHLKKDEDIEKALTQTRVSEDRVYKGELARRSLEADISPKPFGGVVPLTPSVWTSRLQNNAINISLFSW